MHSEASGDTLASSGDTRFCMRVQQLSRRQVARSRSRWSLPVRAALQLWARVLSKGLLPGELESPPPPTAASFGDLQLIILHMMPSPPPQRLGIGLATVALPHVLTATLSPPLALLTLAATARRHSPSPPPRSRRRLALAAAASLSPPPPRPCRHHIPTCSSSAAAASERKGAQNGDLKICSCESRPPFHV